ncbi:hypothetical protein [Actinocatenispora rupis]|uniref:Alanine-rich protein n=1 Tax=Actinocatenispora rupis TaxID=519421 RepID=A0A8J3J3Q8_9ACTN|nr:hypothetical protein [Actinocatenispora rupis]GID09579.1 hypothetical protein Aru02nite_04680 [Actinocatenispora rupis]
MVTARPVGYAYPWDVLGDPAFPARVRALGLTEVALAASYHSTRAATPMHPGHLVVEAREAALYRPVRERAWAGRRLVPRAADWVPGDDSFGKAATQLRAAGISVTAWIVLCHATHLGTAYPDVAVRNCVGDTYPYALCPSRPEVREYAATLAAEALRGVPVDGVSLEACGQLGLAHNGRHEKTAGVFPPAAERALSVCCCPACAAGWAEAGQDPDQVAVRLADATHAVLDGTAPADAGMPELVGRRIADIVLATRRASAAALRTDVLAAVRGARPDLRVTLHGRGDPWATSPDVALDAESAADVDAVLMSCWPTTSATVESLAATRALLPDGVALGAYLTVLPPADPAAVVDHAGALLGAGATELHLYHLGLAGPSGQALLAEIVRRCHSDENDGPEEPDPVDD